MWQSLELAFRLINRSVKEEDFVVVDESTALPTWVQVTRYRVKRTRGANSRLSGDCFAGIYSRDFHELLDGGMENNTECRK